MSTNVYGVPLSSIENLKLMEYLHVNGIAMNTKTVEERKHIVLDFLKTIKKIQYNIINIGTSGFVHQTSFTTIDEKEADNAQKFVKDLLDGLGINIVYSTMIKLITPDTSINYTHIIQKNDNGFELKMAW